MACLKSRDMSSLDCRKTENRHEYIDHGILKPTKDKNLKRDWFSQEKIAGEPESGWLELRWIMPRGIDHCSILTVRMDMADMV